jgi:hypothetical protein
VQPSRAKLIVFRELDACMVLCTILSRPNDGADDGKTLGT